MYDISLKTKEKRRSYHEQLKNLNRQLSGILYLPKKIGEKTLKAYRIDLRQFFESIATPNVLDITSYTLESYIADLHMKYKPKTVKRKNASMASNHRPIQYLLIHLQK